MLTRCGTIRVTPNRWQRLTTVTCTCKIQNVLLNKSTITTNIKSLITVRDPRFNVWSMPKPRRPKFLSSSSSFSSPTKAQCRDIPEFSIQQQKCQKCIPTPCWPWTPCAHNRPEQRLRYHAENMWGALDGSWASVRLLMTLDELWPSIAEWTQDEHRCADKTTNYCWKPSW